MKSDNTEFTDDAFRIIRDADPARYARMAASDLDVHVISRGDEPSIEEFLRDRGWLNAMALIEILDTAFGVTNFARQDGRYVGTFLNRPAIESQARKMGVPVADFLADVLVHEFDHQESGGQNSTEAHAFDAGTAFARKLPPPEGSIIARFSQEVKAQSA